MNAMFNVVLVEPEIPANTGNIGRTCVVAGARLHLVRPLGFSLDAKTRRRAGLLYWDHVDLRVHDSWDAFLEREFGAETLTQNVGARNTHLNIRSDYTSHGSFENAPNFSSRLHLATKKAQKTYAQAEYKDGDYLVFGKESTGLPEEMLAKYSQCCERIPMLDDRACGFCDDAKGAGAENNSESLVKVSGFLGGGEGEDTQLTQDICGNFVDAGAYSVNALNLSNSVAIMLYEALRQTGFQGMES